MKPTEELKKEHEAVKLMLRILQEISKRLDAGEKISAKHLTDILEFIRVFTDKCHHMKEEELLFPALESAGVARERGPIGVMLYEHQEAREFVKGMNEALEKFKEGEKKAGIEFARNARNYVELLTSHIYKEDNILYPMADDKLSATVQRELEQGFEKIEKEVIGPGRHEEFHRLLKRLEEEYLKHS
jgi:hemerythrin-like domain-containing protein